MSVHARTRTRALRLLSHAVAVSAVALVPLHVAFAHGGAGADAGRLEQGALVKPMTSAPVAAPAPPGLPNAGTAPVAPDLSITGIIRAAAARAGANPSQLLRVAECESGLNPRAYNARSGASGLFQFLPWVFRAHGGTNIWDPRQQADIAARMFAAGYAYQWTCR